MTAQSMSLSCKEAETEPNSLAQQPGVGWVQRAVAAAQPRLTLSDVLALAGAGTAVGCGLNTPFSGTHRLFAATVRLETLTGRHGALARSKRRGQHGELRVRRMGGHATPVGAWLGKSPQ